MNSQLISKNTNTPGYEIEADTENGISVVFYPVDLSEKEGSSIVPFGGLEDMFEHRKQRFLADIALMTELSASDGLCNSVQQYSLINGGSRIVAISSLYRGERISERMPLRDIMLAVSAICRAVSEIFKVSRTADISLDDIICEKDDPGVIHILYVSSALRENRLGRALAEIIMGCLKKTNATPGDMVTFDAVINSCALHPLAKRSLLGLFSELVAPDRSVSWDKCAETASGLAAMPESPFFLHVPKSITCAVADLQTIDDAFEQSDIVALYPAGDAARNAAVQYGRRRFVHVACADCSGGIRSGIESESFALSSGESRFDNRLAVIESMDGESTLLIFDNFNEDDKDFSRISGLAAKIILISDCDLSDYGLTSIMITEG